jgi:predicted nucleic acid-binding protein
VTTKPVIIADSGPLIALSIIGQLELLRQLYQQVWIPPAVWDEVVVQGRGLPDAESVGRLSWLEIHTPNASSLPALMILMDRGEAEAIALAQGIPDSTVLLDDAKARRVAEHFGIRRIGTLGILRRAKQTGLIESLRPFIEQLQNNGIYVQQKLVETVLRDEENSINLNLPPITLD